MDPSHQAIAKLKAELAALQKKYEKDMKKMNELVLQAYQQEVDHSIEILAEEIQSQFHYHQTLKDSLSAGIKTQAIAMEKYLLCFPVGKLIRPTPKKPSVVVERLFQTSDEIKALFPNLLRKVYIGNDYAELNGPLSIAYSSNTKRLRVRFSYQARRKNGKKVVFDFVDFDLGEVIKAYKHSSKRFR
jgi:hypothetical protein